MVKGCVYSSFFFYTPPNILPASHCKARKSIYQQLSLNETIKHRLLHRFLLKPNRGLILREYYFNHNSHYWVTFFRFLYKFAYELNVLFNSSFSTLLVFSCKSTACPIILTIRFHIINFCTKNKEYEINHA